MSIAITHDLDCLNYLYSSGFQSDFLDNALRKLIHRQIERDETDLQKINEALANFEHRFNMTSNEFWGRYQAGELADTADFTEWNAFYKMHQRITNRLAILHSNASRE
jgi:hypothetical protein